MARPGLETYRQALVARRRDLTATLATPGEELVEMSGDDQAQAHQHEAVSLGLNSLGYGQIRLIEEALDRLAAGDYGACLACDGLIPARRLKAVPWTRYCVCCQERIDESGGEAAEELPFGARLARA